MNYTINDFTVGDSVFFKHPTIPEHDLYWKVISIDVQNQKLELKVNENGENDHQWIDLKYIYRKEF